MISRLLTLGAALLLAPNLATAQTCATPSSGPDVIVGSLSGISDWGGVGSTAGYSIGTTSCNLGDQTLSWISNTNQHPVIGQNIYRLHDGRFEQIGQGWLKHGFLALAQSLCCPCNNPGTGSQLGIGCSDPYGSGLNGSQSGLGPRSEVNPSTGFFPYPFTHGNQGSSGDAIYKRIQVAHDDLDSSSFPGALYYGEGHYIASDDAASGNGDNNVSYRRITVSSFSGNSWNLSMSGSTNRMQPAINAWQAADPGVTLTNVHVAGDGLIVVGSNAEDNGNGTWDYEYAVYNLNSDRAARALTVPIQAGTVITNVGFHDCDNHSGEPYSNVDWSSSVSGSSVTWSTDTIGANPNANAIRWGTLYNFRFTANVAPSTGDVTVGMFKTGLDELASGQIPGVAGPPTHDGCATALPIVGLGSTAFNSTNATNSGFGGISCGSIAADIFYQWTVPADGDYVIDTCGSSFDTSLNVHNGVGCAAVCAGSSSNDCGDDGEVVLVGATTGDQVLIQVGGSLGGTGSGAINISVVIPPPPANNDCGNAQGVVLGATAISNLGATDSNFFGATLGCQASNTGIADVFYQWTVPATGCYEIDLCGASFDTTLSLYNGSGCSAICREQNDDACGTASSITTSSLTAGDQILIQVGGYGGATGSGTLTIAGVSCPAGPPANDDCSTADVAFEGTTAWDNSLATTSGFDGGDSVNCMSPVNADNTTQGQMHGDLFWTFTAPCDGDWTFDTDGSTVVTDTRIAVHLGSTCSATCLASNDDIDTGGGNYLSSVTVSLNSGTTYMVQTGTWTANDTKGDGVLNINRVGGPCPANSITIGCDPANDHIGGTYAKMNGSSFGSGFQSDLHLDIVDGPANQFGFILVSSDGSGALSVFNGVLCLGSPSARYTLNAANNQANSNLNSIGQFDGAGVFQNLAGTASSTGGTGFDVPNALPFTPAGQSIQSGDTWIFQCWFRDTVVSPGDSANFSNSVEATWI
tara:strand:- start:989 stop:3922 length:2934 start_codon:yes stop_codon:yes gene_type:complete